MTWLQTWQHPAQSQEQTSARRPAVIVPCVLLVALFFGIPAASAQMVPGAGYVYPPVIRAGEVNRVQLGGFDLTADLQWFVHDEHVRLQTLGPPGDFLLPPPPYWIGPRTSTSALPIPREVPAEFHVDAAAPEGFVRWQVANASGASQTAIVFVSRGPELLESRSRDLPQRLSSLPVGVSGRLSRLTEVDRYQFVAERDELITLDLMARRLGADFHAVIQVHDESGRMLADFADTLGLDGGVTFRALAGVTYTVTLRDADFRGDRAYVYRLHISGGPGAIVTVPAAGQRGTSAVVDMIGAGLVTGQPVTESLRQEVNFSGDASQPIQTLTLATPAGTGTVSLPLSDLPEQTRVPVAAGATPAVQTPAVQTVTAPGAVTGQMTSDPTGHRFQWQAGANEPWRVSLQSRAVGSYLDVALEILDPEGKRIADNDDLPGTTDAGVAFTTTTAGPYTAVVRSFTAASTSGDLPGGVYRLELRRQTADFALSVPQQITLPLGGKTELTVQALREGGFASEIRLTVDGLPAGVSLEGDPVIPANANEVKLPLQSAADAAVVAAVIRIRGTAVVGESEVTRQALADAGGSLCPFGPRTATPKIPQILLALTMPAPFSIQVVDRERQHDVHRGTTFLAELDIVREPGFSGEIQLEMSARQDRYRRGILGGILIVPPEQTKVFYPCFVPEWLGTELTCRIVVHGVAAIPDPRGTLRCVSRAGDARITMIMEGALLKLTAVDSELAAPPGVTLEIPVSIARSPRLPLETKVELTVPEEISGLLQADAVILPPGQDRGTLRIRTVADPRLLGPWQLTVKATALQDGRWPVISQTDIPLRFTTGSSDSPAIESGAVSAGPAPASP